MPTLIQAIRHAREQGTLPEGGVVSVRDLTQRFRPSPTGSMRALLASMYGLNPTTRWGIVVTTITGLPRVTTLPLEWFERLFDDGDGVASYFRQMSGDRQVFSWRVFGPHDMYTAAEKAKVAGQGAAAESQFLRAVARDKGIPVDEIDRFVWVIDQPGASGGTAGGNDLFIAAEDFTQQIVCHEIGHSFGVVFEGDRYVDGVVQGYGDSFCVMDNGPFARSFPNPRLEYDRDGHQHQTSGPVMCAAHLAVVGWLDRSNNVVERTSNNAQSDVLIVANQGAPPVGSKDKVALVIKPVPANANSGELWVEYRLPIAFDRFIDRPVSTNNVDMPEGALVMHELRPDRHAILVGWVPARNGQTIAIPGTPHAVEIVSSSEPLRNAVLRIRRA